MKYNYSVLISIVVPIYNSEKTLNRCLSSIESQVYLNWECFLINDGSTDSSILICKEWENKDSRFILIDKLNGGVSSARNKGLDFANGEWIVFVDSDDYLTSDHLKKMKECSSDSVDLVMTGYLKVTNDKTIEHRYSKNNYIGKEEICAFLEETDFLEHQQPWDRMYRNKGCVRFDEKLSLSEDRLYCYQYLMSCRGIATNDAVTYVHDVTDENSLSYRKYPSSMNEYRYNIYKKMNFDLIKRYCLTSDYTKKFFKDYIEDIYACLINAYLDEGNKVMYHFTRILYRLKLK